MTNDAMTNDVLRTLTGAYVLNALDDDEREAFERYMARSPECRAEVETLREAAAALAETDVRAAPPAALRARVLMAIEGTPQVPTTGAVEAATTADRSAVRTTPSGAAAARELGGVPSRDATAEPWWRGFLRPVVAIPLVTAAAIALALVVRQQEPMRTADRARYAAVEAVMRGPDRQDITLTAPGGTTAQFVYAPSVGKGVLLVHRLAPIEADRTYEFWVIGPSGPVPAGTFRPDANGDATHLVPFEVAQAVAVGVTIEPEGGSPQPTGEILIQGELPPTS